MPDVVRYLQLAGRWDLAVAAVAPDAVDRRAELLVDRQLWRMDAAVEAAGAVAEVAAAGRVALAGLLDGQLRYWRMLHTPGRPADELDQARRSLTAATRDPALAGWAAFWLGVLAENIGRDRGEAAVRYAEAAAAGGGDRLLGSYVDRHQGFHRYLDGALDEALLLLRRSLYGRAALGAVPQVAAAQAALADALAEVDSPSAVQEREVLLSSARVVADELGLTWLRARLAS
jgi:hypothetical protein